MLTLYLSPGFSSTAPHIALHEIGVDFETRWIAFEKREQYSLDYLVLNPEGKVPTLLVHGRPLTEVAAILDYLAKRFPTADLFPPDNLEAQAHVISWVSFIARQSIRLAGSAASELKVMFSKRWGGGKRCLKSQRSGWNGGTGPSAVIRSPTSISFASIGASSSQPTPLRRLSPVSPPIMIGC